MPGSKILIPTFQAYCLARYLENADRFPEVLQELRDVCTVAHASEGKVPLFVDVSVETFEKIGVISFNEVLETMWKLFTEEMKRKGYA